MEGLGEVGPKDPKPSKTQTKTLKRNSKKEGLGDMRPPHLNLNLPKPNLPTPPPPTKKTKSTPNNKEACSL